MNAVAQQLHGAPPFDCEQGPRRQRRKPCQGTGHKAFRARAGARAVRAMGRGSLASTRAVPRSRAHMGSERAHVGASKVEREAGRSQNAVAPPHSHQVAAGQRRSPGLRCIYMISAQAGAYACWCVQRHMHGWRHAMGQRAPRCCDPTVRLVRVRPPSGGF